MMRFWGLADGEGGEGMSALKRTGNALSALIDILFVLLMCCVLIATVILDKTIDSTCPNTVTYANAVYYLAAAALMVGLWHACYGVKRRPRMKRGTYYGLLAALALVVAAPQFFIARWAPYDAFISNGDFGSVSNGAWSLANGGTLEKWLPTFGVNPNNLNITFVVSWVYGLFRQPRSAVYVGALLTNLSMVLTSLAVYNVTKRERTALMAAVVGELLVALSWRAFLVYTDNYGMIAVALVLWLYTTDFRPAVKYPLIMLAAAVGAYIKATNLLLIAAVIGAGLVRWLRADAHRFALKRAALYAGCFAAVFGGMFAAQGYFRKFYGFHSNAIPKNAAYLFMVGQNTKMLGVVGGDNQHLRDKYIKQYGNTKDVSRACFEKALRRIRARGVWGNIAFYEKKINVAYNDGYFNNTQREKMFEMDKTFLYNLYIQDGAYYQVPATLFQILWDAVLLTMSLYALSIVLRVRARRRARRGKPAGALCALYRKRPDAAGEDVIRLLMIIALAINAYLMCLEGRAKYLYMFTPMYIGMLGIMFHRLSVPIAAALRKGRERA